MAVDLGMLATYVSAFNTKYAKNFKNAVLKEEQFKEQIIEIFKEIDKGLSFLYGQKATDRQFFDAFYREAKARVTFSFEESTTLQDDDEYRPWVSKLWREIEDSAQFWQAYSSRLRFDKHWSDETVEEINKVADDVLDHCGNPRETSYSWDKRGMVIGDVQAGKTALYAGLINKAADAGYKVIVVLAGLLENLRSQTQERLEYDFVGRSTRNEKIGKKKTETAPTKRIGVGNMRDEKNSSVSWFTTVNRDFHSNYQEKGISVSSLNSCVFLVVKKNASVLKNLNSWLKDNNMPQGMKIAEPLLVIDDEADCASINTNDEDEKPTAINREIRRLLSYFSHSSYVAFTATPYANIFIDPELRDDELDLFPKDFITYMSIPSTYYGVHGMIDDYRGTSEVLDPTVLMIEEDEENGPFPLKHKKDFAKTLADSRHPLPESMLEALRQFLLINAIRDLRGEENTHRTMMVNASRFTDVQNALSKRLRVVLSKYQNELRLCARASDAEGNSVYRAFKQCFDRYFPHCGCKWKDVLKQSPASSQGIVTVAVNQSSSDTLNYSDHEQGLRAIAVGGLSLSRGLTLEGLCVSYLYRTTAAYDTLMQMGRWFGYRSYKDLCRTWMTSRTYGYFEDIARAMDDLKEQIKEMKKQHRKPNDFGLKVRQSSGALLIITNRNKMKTSKDVTIRTSFSASLLETAELPNEEEEIHHNRQVVVDLVKAIKAKGIDAVKSGERIVFENVPKKTVAEFVRNFHPHKQDYQLADYKDNEEGVANFIEQTEVAKLQKWDVVIWSKKAGADTRIELGDTGLKLGVAERRVIDQDYENGTITFSHHRFSDVSMEEIGVDPEDVKSSKKDSKGVTASGKENSYRYQLRRHRPKPLLVVVPVRAKFENEVADLSSWFPAYMLSFCEFEADVTNRGLVHYKANKVWAYEFGQDEDD